MLAKASEGGGGYCISLAAANASPTVVIEVVMNHFKMVDSRPANSALTSALVAIGDKLLSRPDIRLSRPDIRPSRPDIRLSRNDIRLSRTDIRLSRPDILLSRPSSRVSIFASRTSIVRSSPRVTSASSSSFWILGSMSSCSPSWRGVSIGGGGGGLCKPSLLSKLFISLGQVRPAKSEMVRGRGIEPRYQSQVKNRLRLGFTNKRTSQLNIIAKFQQSN
jgi:hypothetical protein